MNDKYTSKNDLLDSVTGLELYKKGDGGTKYLYLASTSGSTGKPLLIVRKEPENPKEHHSLRDYGNYLSIAARRQHALFATHEIIKHGDAANYVLHIDKNELDLVDLPWLCKQMDAQVLSGLPQTYLTLKNQTALRSQKNPCHTISKILIVRGLLERQNKKKLAEFFPNSEIEFRYMMSECTSIGVSCSHIVKKFYGTTGGSTPVHPIKQVEILDADKDGWGEIIISTSQLHNYKTGDLGKIIMESCVCGAKSVLLVKGRAHQDRIHSVGATFLLEEIEKIFATFKNNVTDYSVEIRDIESHGVLSGKVTILVALKGQTDDPLSRLETIKNVFEKELFVTKSRTLGELIHAGIFLPTDVKIVEEPTSKEKPMRLRKMHY